MAIYLLSGDLVTLEKSFNDHLTQHESQASASIEHTKSSALFVNPLAAKLKRSY